ncbi:MAG TPA: chemotaxis protein CheB [Steroidobacteraceae bacterium]
MSVERKNRAGPSRINVVGIGASAGGIEALREFFGALSGDLGLAYVVIVHLAPDHESELAAILSRKTKMPVVEVSDGAQQLNRNSVYVIPPDRKLELLDGSIRAVPFVDEMGRRSAIDVFFRSVAENYGDGFAVIMSGGGSDGTVGAKAIKEAGGLVLVQDPREATHEAMPRAVIASEIADVVLPVRELAHRLGELSQYKEKLAPLIPPPLAEPTIDEDGETALKRILVRMRRDARTMQRQRRRRLRARAHRERAAVPTQGEDQLHVGSRRRALHDRGSRACGQACQVRLGDLTPEVPLRPAWPPAHRCRRVS